MQVDAGASLTMNSVTIANGYSNSSLGGGLLNSGTLTITNSTFSGNHGGWGGGGIDNEGGALTITNSSFCGNNTGYGGGVFASGGTLVITNSTFSGNSAGTLGGGIYNFVGSTLTITNSTFSDNGGGWDAAGIYNQAGTVTLRNTIIANSSSGGNCSGGITNGGNNIDDGASCGWGAVSGSISSTNPMLGALANNGGPTKTFALLAGSPAINGVTFNAPNSAPSTDQRGVARPRGAGYDIGAYERKVPDLSWLMLLLD